MTAATVLGFGHCTPAGASDELLWSALVQRSPKGLDSMHIGGAVGDVVVQRATDVHAEQSLKPHEQRRLDRPHLLALSAAESALHGIDLRAVEPGRIALVVGTGYGVGSFPDEQRERYRDRGLGSLSPLSIPLSMPNTVAAHLSLYFGLRGISPTICTGCSSGASAIGEGLELLRSRRADLVIAGGVDSLVQTHPLAGFNRLGAMSPSGVCRPFDSSRDGFVMGEGAAFLVLVRQDCAVPAHDSRGEIAGYATNVESYHIVAPEPSGSSAADCIRLSLNDAGITPRDVVAVNAHGTATPANDSAEANALVDVFGRHGPPVTAPKGVTGHLIGASGALEVIISLLMLKHRLCPAAAGTRNIDSELVANVCVDDHVRLERGYVLSNSFAFGGHNVSLVVR